MPGCVLRIQSKTRKVEELLRASGLKAIAIHKKGHPRVPGGASLSRSSGFNVEVSTADGVLGKQTRSAVRFLKQHARGLARMRRHKTFVGMTLDFGLYYRASPDHPWPTYRLPASLVELAAKHGIALEFSFYGVESPARAKPAVAADALRDF